MRPATLEEFASDPVGRYVSGNEYIHFCATPELWGVVLWGRPDAAVARALGQSLVFELQAPAVPHASLVDASRLLGSDTGSFRALERFMTHFQEALRRWVMRLALVRPPGLSGAMVAGVFEVVPRPYPVRVFDGVEGAVRWLDAEGRLGAAPAEVVDSVAALHEEAERSTPLVVRLRSLLESRLSGIDRARGEQPLDLAEAARALGTSDRSLQRRLREADTSFSAELGAARVRVAQRMLLSTDEPLTRIALEVGCASLQHFGVLFRKVTGEAPSAWRDRERSRRRTS